MEKKNLNFGRTTVIKSLLIHKLNHLFISLRTPSNETIVKLCEHIIEFLWKSKVDKIKRPVITQHYFSGGMKLVDIKNFIISLKCSWIKSLTKSYKPWMDILLTITGHDFLQKLYDFRDTFILECLQKENNAFWKYVFNYWLKYIKTINNHPNIKGNFLNIPVWYIFNIRVANKTVFIKSWYEKGYRYCKIFFYEDCNRLVFEAFKCTYMFNATAF